MELLTVTFFIIKQPFKFKPIQEFYVFQSPFLADNDVFSSQSLQIKK